MKEKLDLWWGSSEYVFTRSDCRSENVWSAKIHDSEIRLAHSPETSYWMAGHGYGSSAVVNLGDGESAQDALDSLYDFVMMDKEASTHPAPSARGAYYALRYRLKSAASRALDWAFSIGSER